MEAFKQPESDPTTERREEPVPSCPKEPDSPTSQAEHSPCPAKKTKPDPCPASLWLQRIRRPALSIQYALEKRHIPDPTEDPTGQTAQKGANSDTLSVKGGFTIRYFDFAAGIVSLLVTSWVMEALCHLRGRR